jgi:hypothetical protein
VELAHSYPTQPSPPNIFPPSSPITPPTHEEQNSANSLAPTPEHTANTSSPTVTTEAATNKSSTEKFSLQFTKTAPHIAKPPQLNEPKKAETTPPQTLATAQTTSAAFSEQTYSERISCLPSLPSSLFGNTIFR